MAHLPQIPRRTSPDDQAIEAVVAGRPVDPAYEPWAAFARRVRTTAVEGPVPVPNAELAGILRGDVEPDRGGPPVRRVVSVTARAAALGAAKVVLGASLAAAGVSGAGVAGVLPDAADDAVRGAIETVTPLQFEEGEGGERSEGVGGAVADDATGRSDGEPGVDGRSVAEEAPGAEHRPDGAGPPDDAGAPPPAGPGRPDAPGLDRAGDTPADDAPADDTPADDAPAEDIPADLPPPAQPPGTAPDTGATAGPDPGSGRPLVVPSVVPSTVPTPRADRAG